MSKITPKTTRHWPVVIIVIVILLCPLAILSFSFHANNNQDTGKIVGINIGFSRSRVAFSDQWKVQVLVHERGYGGDSAYGPPPEKWIAAASVKGQGQVSNAATHFTDMAKRNQAERARPPKHDFPNSKKSLAETQDVLSDIFAELKAIAETYTGEKVSGAVVTVPASFNDFQREYMHNSAVSAGLSPIRLINEPVAAAIGYALDETTYDKLIVVFDLGSNKLEVSVLELDYGGYEVLSSVRQSNGAGIEFNNRILDYILDKQPSKMLHADKIQMKKLQQKVESAKRSLSSQPEATIEIEAPDWPADLSVKLTRATFEELNEDLFESGLKLLKRALKEAYISKGQIDSLIFAGESSRIPRIRNLITDFFSANVTTYSSMTANAVVYGAALQTHHLNDNDDEECTLTLDVNPATLGVETASGYMARLIPRNTAIPTKKSQYFTTSADDQSEIIVNIYAGERVLAKDNVPFGKLKLTGIPLAPAGTPRIEISFQMDPYHELEITVTDTGTGKFGKTIVSHEVVLGLGDDWLERSLIPENAEEDKKHLERLGIDLSENLSDLNVNRLSSEMDPKIGGIEGGSVDSLSASGKSIQVANDLGARMGL